VSSYTAEQWREARALVVHEGKTYDEAAALVGVGVSSLQKRAARDGWQQARREALERVAAYRDRVAHLKSRMLEKATKSLNPQDIHAWQGVERAYPEHRYAALDKAQRQTITVRLLQLVVEYLGEQAPKLVPIMAAHVERLGLFIIEADWFEER